MELALLIVIAVILITIVVILAIIIYHQMLLLNEVNKRIFVFAKEAIDKERITMEEYNRILMEQTDNLKSTVQEYETQEQFDPHAVKPDDEY